MLEATATQTNQPESPTPSASLAQAQEKPHVSPSSSPLCESDAALLESAVFDKERNAAQSCVPSKDGTAEECDDAAGGQSACGQEAGDAAACDDAAGGQAVGHDAACDDAACHVPQKCTYVDCLMGGANTPAAGPGKAVFQLLMVGGMVSFMATINGLLHSGLDFFTHALWMYPLVFCIAFLVRIYVGDRIVGFVAPRLILPRLRGLARNLAMTALNVGVMATIMGSIMTLLLNGLDNYGAQLASTLPITMAAAALVNFFIVGPIVKMIYNNVIAPSQGVRLIRIANKYVMPWTAIFGN